MNIKHSKKSSLTGDTIVEVMLATAIAALAIVLALAVMNRSFTEIQLAVETTFVRQSIDGEADTLRYLRDEYLRDSAANDDAQKAWSKIVTIAKTSGEPSQFGSCTPNHPFFIARKGATDNDTPSNDAVDIKRLSVLTNYSPAQTFARIGQGICIEAVAGGGTAGVPPFIDFHIRACWEPPFSGLDNATLGTIVRLYYE